MTAPRETARVSVIVPAWQGVQDAEATLQCVYDQDCEAVEIIVVDDGSRSAARDVTRGFLRRANVAARFSRIVFVEESSVSNASRAINRGLRECRGDYINILEAGDALAVSRFSHLLRACAESGAELAFSRVEILSDTSARWSTEAASLYSVQDDIEFLPTVGYALLRSQCALATANLFFSRRLAAHVGGFGEHEIGYGWDFALRCVLVTEPLFVPEPLYYYRLRGGENLPGTAASASDSESILKNYLFLCRNRPVENPVAPSPAWGPFFASFVEASQYGKYLAKP